MKPVLGNAEVEVVEASVTPTLVIPNMSKFGKAKAKSKKLTP